MPIVKVLQSPKGIPQVDLLERNSQDSQGIVQAAHRLQSNVIRDTGCGTPVRNASPIRLRIEDDRVRHVGERLDGRRHLRDGVLDTLYRSFRIEDTGGGDRWVGTASAPPFGTDE